MAIAAVCATCKALLTPDRVHAVRLTVEVCCFPKSLSRCRVSNSRYIVDSSANQAIAKHKQVRLGSDSGSKNLAGTASTLVQR